MGLKTGQAHSFIYGWFKIDFMASLLRSSEMVLCHYEISFENAIELF